MSFGILMPEIEHGKSTDQNVADVPSGDLISRADAIEVGNKIIEELSLSSIDWDDLKYWAKELFEALPSADVVSRDEYIKLLEESIWKSEHIGKMFEYIDDCVTEMCDRQKVNSAEWVEQKEREFEELHRPKGEWLIIDFDITPFNYEGFYCSNCRHIYDYKMNFCPNCGADMQLDK